MKKTILYFLLVIGLIISSFGLIACGEDPMGDNPQNHTLLDFTDVVFESSSIDYDGEAHTIIATTDVTNATITYENNGPFVNAGSYQIKAKIEKTGYNTKNITATLTIRKINYDMSGVVWNYSSAFTYDGQDKEITVSNLPQGVSVAGYSNNKKTNAGSYQASVEFLYDTLNHNKPTIPNCFWVINKAEFVNVSFENETVEYDGNSHSIVVVGNLPTTAKITYTSNVQGITNSATEKGEYTITATITDANFNTKTLTAVLKIKTTESARSMLISGDTLFFQNAKDDNTLYAYNFDDKEVVKVSYDNAVEMIESGNNEITYISKSLFSSIKKVSYTEGTKQTTISSIISKNANYIQRESDNVYYYVYNGLTNDKSGIYKADFSTQEPTITLLSQGKAKFLKLSDSKLYFADGLNDYKLASINTTDTNQARTNVVDEKINNLICRNGVLYFTINKTLGDYIAKYTISTGVTRKLTSDAGINLSLVGNYLYYINVDKLTTALVGDGVYKISINQVIDNYGSGEQVIEASEDGICSLVANDSYLYYYDCSDYKLIQYSTQTQTKKDILEGFVKPEPPAPLSLGSQVEAKDGIIYYLDLYDGKTLHTYNPATKENRKISSEKVENFTLVGDYIYINAVSYLVNNDLFRLNIKTGEEPLQINKGDCTNIVSDGTYLYYTEGSKIYKDSLDGKNPVIIFDGSADNLVLHNGSLYFCAKTSSLSAQTIMKIENVASKSTAQNKVCVNEEYKSDVFTIMDGEIYFRQNYGIGYQNHRLAKMKVDGTGYVSMVENKTDPTEIVVSNGYIYYANAAFTAANYSLFKIATNGTEGSKVEITTNKFVTSICIDREKAYFIDWYTGGVQGDSHLYVVNIDGTGLEKIA